MRAQLVERAIIQNRPGEPFVLVERAPADISDLSMLDWQAGTVPPTWAEVQTWAAALQVETDRATITAQFTKTLAHTDVWCARHVEDGVSLTAARKQYRSDLRAAISTVASSADPASVAIPVEPVYP